MGSRSISAVRISARLSQKTDVAFPGGRVPAALPGSCVFTVAIVNSRHRCDDPGMNDLPARAWRDLAADWRVWVSLVLCLLIATLAWLLGYD